MIDAISTSLLWAGKQPRLALATLQLPIDEAGLALFNLYFYYLVSIMFWLLYTSGLPSLIGTMSII